MTHEERGGRPLTFLAASDSATVIRCTPRRISSSWERFVGQDLRMN